METALVLSQTIFYFVASGVIIALGILAALLTWHLAGIARELEKISQNFEHASDEMYDRIRDVIDRLSGLPFLSFLFTSNHGKKSKRSKGSHK